MEPTRAVSERRFRPQDSQATGEALSLNSFFLCFLLFAPQLAPKLTLLACSGYTRASQHFQTEKEAKLRLERRQMSTASIETAIEADEQQRQLDDLDSDLKNDDMYAQWWGQTRTSQPR